MFFFIQNNILAAAFTNHLIYYFLESYILCVAQVHTHNVHLLLFSLCTCTYCRVQVPHTHQIQPSRDREGERERQSENEYIVQFCIVAHIIYFQPNAVFLLNFRLESKYIFYYIWWKTRDNPICGAHIFHSHVRYFIQFGMINMRWQNVLAHSLCSLVVSMCVSLSHVYTCKRHGIEVCKNKSENETEIEFECSVCYS